MKRTLVALLAVFGLISSSFSKDAPLERLPKVIGKSFVGTPPEIVKLTLGTAIHYTTIDDDSYGLDMGPGQDGRTVVLFNKFIGREGKTAKWKVIDAVKLPATVKIEQISTFCAPRGVDYMWWANDKFPQNYILAVPVFDPEASESKSVKAAWTINWASLKIEATNPANVNCYREESSE